MKFFRTHEKLIVWIVVVIIIPVFGIGTLLTAMIGRKGSKAVYGRLDGRKVTQDDLVKFAVKHGYTRTDADTLIQLYKLQKQYEQIGFRVSDKEVAAYIREKGMFADEEGEFSNKRFKSYLKRNNLTQELFIEGMKERILSEKLSTRGENLLRQPVPVTKDEILFQYHHDKDRYKVKYVKIPVEDLPKEEVPGYEEIEAVYKRARKYHDSGNQKAADAFFKEFPIKKDVFKQWIIVEYVGISRKDIEDHIEVADSAVLEYYAKHRDTKYRIKKEDKKEDKKKDGAKEDGKNKDNKPASSENEEKAADDSSDKTEDKDRDASAEKDGDEKEKEKEDGKKEKPVYRKLDDNLKKEIAATLTSGEAGRILELLKEKIRERKISAENKGNPITLKELAAHNYFREIELSESFTRKPGRIVYWDISNPVELPQEQMDMYTKGIRIDAKLGRISFQDLQNALLALVEPDPDIATSFLKTRNGYCMFAPEWWPNMQVDSPGNRRTDLTYTVPFPDKKTLGLEPKPDTEELTDNALEQSLLDIKLENMRLKASINLFNTIRKQLTEKKAKDRAREKAEEVYAEITPKTFDDTAKAKALDIVKRPFETLPGGGEPVRACYYLKPAKEKSPVFFSPDKGPRQKPFFGIGLLLEKKPADDTDIPQKEIDRVRSSYMRSKQSEYLKAVERVNSMTWKPK